MGRSLASVALSLVLAGSASACSRSNDATKPWASCPVQTVVANNDHETLELSDGRVYKGKWFDDSSFGTTVEVHVCEVDSKIDGTRHFGIFDADGYRVDAVLDTGEFIDDTPKPVLKTLPDR